MTSTVLTARKKGQPFFPVEKFMGVLFFCYGCPVLLLLIEQFHKARKKVQMLSACECFVPVIRNNLVSSWPYGITYFWLLGQVLCEAQRREHSRSYVTGVVTKPSA